MATALALLAYFWRDWLRVVTGFASSVRQRRVKTPDERLAWMIIIGTIPVGIAGLLPEPTFRTVLGRPIPAAIFLTVNGVVLYAAERLRHRAPSHAPSAAGDDRLMDEPAYNLASDRRLASLPIRETTLIATAQVAALLPGIRRSGVTMAAGLARGLSHEDAARFSFLLAMPVILAAGVLKLPDLFGPLGEGIGGQVMAGGLASGVAAYLSVRFLTRYFRTRTLTPFAVDGVSAGLGSLAWLTLR